MLYDHLPWKIVSWMNRRFWFHDRALWLQQIHCWLGHPGSGFNVCRYCIEVTCTWCRMQSIRNIEALRADSGWKFIPDRGWACPLCAVAITTALGWEPIKPTE